MIQTKPLFIFELANNHMGDLSHGLTIIEEFSRLINLFPCFDFALKFQYRNLDSFIHPTFISREDLHYIKRFKDTRLTTRDFDHLRTSAQNSGFKIICTPFDNSSVKRIKEESFDYIKIASCSCTDWPLLEEVVLQEMPVIVSVGGASEENIDKLYNFFTQKNIELSILHCVPQYPTPKENSNLGQLSYLSKRYENINIGLSTHENPSDLTNIYLAVAQGARIFEKHIGKENQSYSLNAYSASYDQTLKWLKSAKDAFLRLGNNSSRMIFSGETIESLKMLERAAFSKHSLEAGEQLTLSDVSLAFPPSPGQLLASHFSKFNSITLNSFQKENSQIELSNLTIKNNLNPIDAYLEDVTNFLKLSKVQVPQKVSFFLSHHYGIHRFKEYGLTLIDIINREYCKKLLILLPNQKHPEQYHKKKEETFIILYGDLQLHLNDKFHSLNVGDMITIEPLVKHKFSSEGGCVFEEISTTDLAHDSFYTDESIHQNTPRKTKIMKLI